MSLVYAVGTRFKATGAQQSMSMSSEEADKRVEKMWKAEESLGAQAMRSLPAQVSLADWSSDSTSASNVKQQNDLYYHNNLKPQSDQNPSNSMSILAGEGKSNRTGGVLDAGRKKDVMRRSETVNAQSSQLSKCNAHRGLRKERAMSQVPQKILVHGTKLERYSLEAVTAKSLRQLYILFEEMANADDIVSLYTFSKHLALHNSSILSFNIDLFNRLSGSSSHAVTFRGLLSTLWPGAEAKQLDLMQHMATSFSPQASKRTRKQHRISEAEEVFKALDSNGDGVLTFEEFFQGMKSCFTAEEAERQFRVCFFFSHSFPSTAKATFIPSS